MTAAEKKKVLGIIRAAEFLFSESCALKVVLLAHRVPQRVWEKEAAELMDDPELSGQLHAKFQHLYDEIEKAHDETEAFESLLKALPKPKKEWN